MIRPVLLVAIPLLLAFISVLLPILKRYLLLLAAVANVVVVFLIEQGVYWIGNHEPPFGISLVVDDYSFLGLEIINILFLLLVFMNVQKIEKVAAFLLIALAGLNGMLMTGDLFNLFVFMEIGAIAAYIITVTNKKLLHVFHYIVIGVVGSSLYLFGVILLYSQYGTLNMGKMSELIGHNEPVSYIPIILIFAGLAVETKLLPFNSWVKGILGDSDSLVGSLIGSIYSGTFLLVFGRLFTDVFVLNDQVRILFSIVAVVTIIAGEFSAFTSKRLREILLYSSIAQGGLAVVLFLNGLAGMAVLVVAANVVAKYVLYFLSGVIALDHDQGEVLAKLGKTETHYDDVEDLGGLFVKNPVNGLTFTIAALSLASLPLFFGFWVKMNVLFGLFQQGDYVLPAIILLTSLVEGAYIVRLLVKLWNPGEEGTKASTEEKTWRTYTIDMVVCVALLVISSTLIYTGIEPDYAVDTAEKAAETLEYNADVDFIKLEGGVK